MRTASVSFEEVKAWRDVPLITPMRRLIEKFPDIAEKVLDKCYKEVKIE